MTRRETEVEVEITQHSVDHHLASLPQHVRVDMELLDTEIVARMPDASRVLFEGKFWGGSDQKIIGYGEFQYTNSSGKTVEWFMVGLAAQKNYLSMYVNAVDDEGYVLARYKDRLGKAKIGSASISFKTVDDVDLGVLMELVEIAATQV
jgi:hypothetical protein